MSLGIDKEKLTYREAQLEDFDGVLRLINLVQPHIPWSQDYFDWQFLNNPAGRARIWIAEHESEIIANYVAVPHLFQADDRTTTAWMVQDVMTHPDFRGLGVMHELSRMCRETLCVSEHPVNYTFPNERSHNSFIRRGWKEAFRIPFRSLEISHVPSATSAGCDSLQLLTEPVAGLDDLWTTFSSNVRFASLRNSEYLKWRYWDRPEATYFPYALLHSDGTLRGFIIMKSFDRGESGLVSHICELFTDPSDEDAVERLLDGAIHLSREEGAVELTAWLPEGHMYEKHMDDRGFSLDRELTRWLIIYPTGFSVEYVADPSHWHLTMGDSDVY
jgi:GNAT superfamily N-acetyltransferase